jgi:hypothetical protein
MSYSDGRPPIPAEIRRRVLVEAGHRCAIPTCRYIEVDVHHIIPWPKSQAHDYETSSPSARIAIGAPIEGKLIVRLFGSTNSIFDSLMTNSLNSKLTYFSSFPVYRAACNGRHLC